MLVYLRREHGKKTLQRRRLHSFLQRRRLYSFRSAQWSPRGNFALQGSAGMLRSRAPVPPGKQTLKTPHRTETIDTCVRSCEVVEERITDTDTEGLLP